MVGPLVPSSSSSLSRGWTLRVIHSQNPELKLETCAPESINTVTFYTSTMMGASLDCPTMWAIGSGFKNGIVGVISCGPVHQAIFILASLDLGLGWECERPIVGWGSCHWWGWATFLQSPLGWFKADARIGHSLAILPLTSKTLGSQWLATPSPLILGSWLPLALPWFPVPSTQCPDSRLWAGVIWSGPPLPLWKFGWVVVLLSLHPHPWPHSQGLPGHWRYHCHVWHESGWPLSWQSAVPSQPCPPGSVVTIVLALSFSWVSSFLLSIFQAVTISYEYQVPGVLYKYQAESQMCLQIPWKRQSLRCCCASTSIILMRHWSWIWFRVPSSLVAKEGTFSLLFQVTL